MAKKDGPACQDLLKDPDKASGKKSGGFILSNEKNPGWLGVIIRDYTTQLYRDYNKPL